MGQRVYWSQDCDVQKVAGSNKDSDDNLFPPPITSYRSFFPLILLLVLRKMQLSVETDCVTILWKEDKVFCRLNEWTFKGIRQSGFTLSTIVSVRRTPIVEPTEPLNLIVFAIGESAPLNAPSVRISKQLSRAADDQSLWLCDFDPCYVGDLWYNVIKQHGQTDWLTHLY